MARWQPLRGDLPAEVVRLVRELRQYVDRCELNTATVAAKTGYSRSSWLRYLNGRRLPPWPAAAGLGRLAQADPEHLRVLWESAAHAWPREGRVAAPEPPPEDTTDLKPAAEDRPARSRLTQGTPALIAAACALIASVLLAQPWDTRPARPPHGAPSGTFAWPWPLRSADDRAAAACRAAGCRGLDPYREKCDRDGIVVHRLRAYDRVLTLEYSPACRASWAEVDTPAGTAALRIATTGGDEQPAAEGGAYTTMVGSGPEAARATVVVAGHQLGVGRYDSWIDDVSGSARG